MNTGEIQEYILSETGIKTSVKMGSGASKGYLIFSPMYQRGKYPEFPFDFRRNFIIKFEKPEPYPTFANSTQLQVFGIEDNRIKYKKERKPKPIDPNKQMKGWGSKNSQMRLDKASARYAKKLNKGNCARYY